MNNKGFSRIITSLAIVGLFVVGLFGFAVYKANNPKGPAIPADNNLAGTSTEQNPADSFPEGIVPSKNTISNSGAMNDGDEDDDEGDDDDDSPANTTNTQPPPTVPNVPVADTTKRTTKYKDGTYTATGSYDSPGGFDEIGITLTLKGGIVTSASAVPMPHDDTSARYQQKFLSGYQVLVVGKNIDTINLGKVSGASLTGIGFNSALAKIKAQAAV